MPNWKKVIVSGSSAVLTTVTATQGFTGSLSGSASSATSASYALSASTADTVKTGLVVTNATHYIPFVDGNNNPAVPEVLGTVGTLTYNPNAGVFNANIVSGSAAVYSGGDVIANSYLRSLNSTGDEGGEIFLNKAVTNTTLTGGVTVDVYQNKLRFFEQGGSARGFYLDISTGGSAASTNLASGGGTVTSVSASGTVSGITLGGGPITGAGTLTLSGTISGLTNSNLSGTAGITNANLANSSITIGTTAISLGASSTTLAGLSSVTSTSFTGSLSGTATGNLTSASTLTAGNLSGTIPSAVLGNSTHYIGTTAVTLNRASANLALTGISSIAFPGSTSGTATLQATATAGTPTLSLPTATGTLVGTGDSGTVTNTMLAGSIANAKLANSSITIGSTTISLGATSTTLAGLTSVTATNFTGTASYATVAQSVLGTVTSASYAVTASYAVNAANTYIGSTNTGTWSIIGVQASGYTQPSNFTGFTLNAATNTLSTTASWATTAASATSATSAGSVTNAVTFNNGGAGDASGTSFNGSAARTISYNTIGAPKTDGTNATGTWGISISGNAATATSATSATNATNSTNVGITDTTTGAGPYYLTFVSSTSGNQAQRVDSTGLTYNATTNAITASIFKGDLVGTASYAGIALTATNAVSADKVLTETTSTAASYYVTFVDSDNGTAASEKLNTNTGAQYNPGTGTLRVVNLLATNSITGSHLGNTTGTASWATNAVTATSATSATTATSATSATTSTYVLSADTRAVASTPETNNASQGVRFDFKQNSTNGLSDGGTYNGVMYFRKYGSGTDWSGGGAHEIGFTDNGNLHHRYGTSTTWGSWYKVLDSNNYNSYAPTLTGTGATGTWNITSSWATRAVTASYALTASYLLGSITSASYAATSSWAVNATSAGSADAVAINTSAADLDLLGVSGGAGYSALEIDQNNSVKWVLSNPTFAAIQVRENTSGQRTYFGALTNAGEGFLEAQYGRMYYYSDRHIFGTNAYGYSAQIDVAGNFDAANDITCGGTKFFDIPHQGKQGWGLKHAAIEGPESAVYFRGKLNGDSTIDLPEYWDWLVDHDTITVSLTPVGQYQALYVKEITGQQIEIGSDGDHINCHYVVYGERKDVDRWDVEYPEYSRTDK
jgi:hypothetical protein